MKLLLKSSGANENFASWAKQFKEISNCLLVEVDTANEKFIAKTFTTDKTLIKYSEITFKDSGYDKVSIKGDDLKPIESLDSRIKVGIFMILSKFIDVISTFTGVEHEMEVDFAQNLERNPAEYHSTNINFKSKTLKIKVRNSNISEFTEISDVQFFNSIYVANDPVNAVVSAEAVKNINSISSLFKESDAQDIMEIYTKKLDDGTVGMFSKDDRNESYDYLMGTVDSENDGISVKVFRQKFIMAIKNVAEDLKIIVSSTNANRLLFETNGGTSKTVISSVKY